ncbi:hypothetical protein [Streptomyces sp. NPDC050738]|uniref:hypothetical protein n=1 Tax=Streptomyces sp. NPDC050738 TaxID=3154744 RepID=UPI00344937DB
MAAFRTAQRVELGRDDHGFPGRDIVDLWEDADWQEYILTGGTASVLDLYSLIDAYDSDDFAMMRPLNAEEIRQWFPGGRPTHAQWQAALDVRPDSVQGLFPSRGKGRCTVLYRDGEPHEVGYWGCTAD